MEGISIHTEAISSLTSIFIDFSNYCVICRKTCYSDFRVTESVHTARSAGITTSTVVSDLALSPFTSCPHIPNLNAAKGDRGTIKYLDHTEEESLFRSGKCKTR